MGWDGLGVNLLAPDSATRPAAALVSSAATAALLPLPQPGLARGRGGAESPAASRVARGDSVFVYSSVVSARRPPARARARARWIPRTIDSPAAFRTVHESRLRVRTERPGLGTSPQACYLTGP